MQNSNDVFLEVRDVRKEFPGVLALDNVNLTIKRGVVLALVGENGAGKSTLMKVLSGVNKMDGGEIFIEGKVAHIHDPLSSQNMGISIIYQELNLLLNMNIAENIFIGREPKKNGFVDKERMHRQAKALLDEVGLDLDTHTPISQLSTAQKQMIEVAKALSFETKLIIMDEPTSSLTDQETQTLFGIVGKLKQKNVAVVFITHRMKEIFEISDEVAVMCDGKMVTTLKTSETDENEVIYNMVGRKVTNIFAKEPTEIKGVALQVKNLNTKGFLKNISFEVRHGEILGFSGLVGAGRSEVMRAIFGIDKKESGEIFVDGVPVSIHSTVDAIHHNIGLVPEDRKEQALILGMSVKRNISLAALPSFRKGLFLDPKKETEVAKNYIDTLQIKTPSEEQIVNNLSGGNQQKVVLGKWLEIQPKILILDEPTRGIDIKTKKEIYLIMSKLAQKGVAIIMISSELPEVLGMSDRVIVMANGKISGELSREEATQESVMRLAIKHE